ncbi:unnamed protein product [Caenorhabditis sp. 36 PRJEB53466]|nr:unnamed protein product [Caenorhabditis sp. 36 PRJEB53466]
MVRPLGRKNISQDIRKAIVIGFRSGCSKDVLAQQFTCSKRAIEKVLKQFRDEGALMERKSPGRPRITSKNVDRNIVRASREDPQRSFTDIQMIVKSPNEVTPSLRTEWANHVFSDESKFNLFGTDGIKWIRRPVGCRFDPSYQLQTVKHGGGSVMVWGCFSGTSIGPLRRITGIMDRYVYEDILEKTMRPWARSNVGQAFVFQQDNDPKHTSKHIKDWFRRRHVNLLDWPSQSPDLNPIEHLWEHVERQLRGIRASNANQKFDQLQSVWQAIPMSVIHTLLDSMPKRCQAVIDAKGYPTKY